MDRKISTAAIYFTIITFFATAICWTLITTLNWPALAEIPLAISIFIQIFALAKTSFKFWTDHKEHVTDVLVNRIKTAIFSLDAQEEEVNI